MNTRVLIDRAAPGAVTGETARSVFAMIAGAASWVMKQRRMRRDRAHLYAMPDYLLSDIGINRLDIDQAVAHGRAGTRSAGTRLMSRRGVGE